MKKSPYLNNDQINKAKSYFNLGLSLLNRSNFSEAESEFRKGLSIDPNSLAFIINIGITLAKQKKTLQAEKFYCKAIKLKPDCLEAYINLADINKYDRPKVARKYLLKAINIQPTNKNALDMLGFTWFMEKKFNLALEYFQKAIDIDPHFQRAMYHITAIFFITGKFDIAWKNYMQRYGVSGCDGSPIGTKIPALTGEINKKNSLLIWTDQGLGDEILQLGIINEFINKYSIKVSVIVTSRLNRIIKRSFPNINFLSTNEAKELTTNFSYQTPAISLSLYNKRDLSKPCTTKKYLHACENKTKELRNRYLNISKNKPLIGISWKSFHSEFGDRKSINLKKFLNKIIDLECHFINLQYGDTHEEIDILPPKFTSKLFTDLDVDPINDLDTFASQVDALDLIITTSNTTAHFAGALGKKTLTLVPKIGPGWLWYWFDTQSHSPWYPRMKILRQNDLGNWDQTLNQTQIELENFLKTL